jgi:hypothetical protein
MLAILVQSDNEIPADNNKCTANQPSVTEKIFYEAYSTKAFLSRLQ